jgi:hypothetical protein
MKRICWLLAALLLFAWFPGCSKKEKAPEAQRANPSTEQATDAIRDFGQRPIDKARETQRLGEDRTRAIDEAMKNLNR